MTLTLYAHPLSSYCWKVLIALSENGAPFEYRQLGEAEADAEMARLWPIGKMPILVDDGRTIVESSIIIEHLDVHHPGPAPLVPADPEDALEVRLIDRVFDNYVMTPMSQIVFNRFCPPEARNAFSVEQARALLGKAYAWLEDRLAGRTWAAGDSFGLADCAAGPALHYGEKVHPFRADFPVLAAYLDRLESRPSLARAIEEAKPFSHMFPQDPG
jgi:glutathione S-transferase